MKFAELPLAGAYVVELEPFSDERGFFARTFCQKEFAQIGFHKQIVQVNHSITKQKGTIRGMHYQIAPACETKIIRCIGGRVFDVMVDIRANSPTLLQWYGLELSKDNFRTVLIPEGFAHGFQAITDNAELIYLTSSFYSPEYERGLRFDDPALSVNWPLPIGTVSAKDRTYPFIGNDFNGIEVK